MAERFYVNTAGPPPEPFSFEDPAVRIMDEYLRGDICWREAQAKMWAAAAESAKA